MSENKTVLTVAALLLAATGICIYQVNSGKNLGHHSQVKSESTCEKVFKSFVWTVADAIIQLTKIL